MVTPHFFWPDKRRRDKDNAVASLKAAFDGLQDGGVIENDAELDINVAIFHVDHAHPRVELIIVSKSME